MKQFASWRSFWDFQQTVRKQNRFIRDANTEAFLQTLLATVEDRVTTWPQDSFLWRAQLGHDWEKHYQEEEYVADIPTPLSPHRMVPLTDQAAEGRANPKGIPHLYTATTQETAMAEVRPWRDSMVSVGMFKPTRDLVTIDCSVNHDKMPIFFDEPSPDKKVQSVWSHVDRAFSKPMTNTDRLADYAPTQIIAELFKCNGFDGLVYKSSLAEGHNVVLFDVGAAKLVSCHLFEVESISYSFKETANPYTVAVKTDNAPDPKQGNAKTANQRTP